jgi:hypothetical protein
MRRPTQAEWNRLKKQYARGPQEAQQSSRAALSGLPDDLFLPDDYGTLSATEGSEKLPKRRQFRRFDETWAEKLLPLLNPIGRLALVLLAEADFHRHIKATSAISEAAKMALKEQRAILAKFELLGLISIEHRGRGRSQIVTPLRLGGRPYRK